MKRLWIAAALLLALLLGTVGNAWYLDGLSRSYQEQLTAAQEMAEGGGWEEARRLTDQVYQDWQGRTFYFHVLLRHTDTDAVHLTFQEVGEYLRLEELDQYTAANARLITQIGLLAEMEQLSWKNVL